MEQVRRIYFWNKILVYATTANSTRWHRHFGASIAISTGQPFRLETRKSSQDYSAALVPPNLEHRSLVPENRMIVIMIDPDSDEFRYLIQSLDMRAIQPLDGNDFKHLRADMSSMIDGSATVDTIKLCTGEILGRLKGKGMVELDPRIKNVILEIQSTFPDVPSIEALARQQKLSANRLMILFKKNLGLPIRRYLLWLRLRSCVPWLVGGSNLTDAAHAAGFADSAHLSRVFRENFGMKPSELFGNRTAASLQIL